MNSVSSCKPLTSMILETMITTIPHVWKMWFYLDFNLSNKKRNCINLIKLLPYLRRFCKQKMEDHIFLRILHVKLVVEQLLQIISKIKDDLQLSCSVEHPVILCGFWIYICLYFKIWKVAPFTSKGIESLQQSQIF